MSSKRSTRNKDGLVMKLKKPEVTEISDDSEEDKSEDESEIVSLSDGAESSDEVIAPKKSRACSYNKAAFSMPDDISKLMNRVLCTACGKQLNPMNHGAVRKHPWLKVVTCKKCYKFLKSGPYTRDKEGIDEQCRWCGDGGRLYGCDFCHNCFCRSCIKRNLGRSEAAEMENEDSKVKWKCYMCQPKKIKSLVENCSKILDYIKKQEEKEKQKEERAKQREKEKLAAAKEKKAQNEKDKRISLPLPGSGKKEKRISLPAPKSKIGSDETKDKTPSKSSFPAPKPKDCIVIDEPEKPVFKHATAKSHLPVYNSRPGDGVTQVQKVGNGLTAVTVGPKAKMAVSMPYKDNAKLNAIPSVNIQPRPVSILPQRPNVYTALSSQLLTPSPLQFQSTTPQAATPLDKKGITTMAKMNDIRALKEQIVPFNVETITEKMTTVAQAFSLTLNSVKTDLAIAKLSSSDLFNSRSLAAYNVKTGLDIFFNRIREIFNLQISMTSPTMNDSNNPIKIEDDIKEEKVDKSIPNGNENGDVKESEKIKSETAECKEESKANVPVKIDSSEASENNVKKIEEEVKVNKKEEAESNSDENVTMETEEDVNIPEDDKENSDKSEKMDAECDQDKENPEENDESKTEESSKEEDSKTKRSTSEESSSKKEKDSGKNVKGAKAKSKKSEDESKSSERSRSEEDTKLSKSKKSSEDLEMSNSGKSREVESSRSTRSNKDEEASKTDKSSKDTSSSKSKKSSEDSKTVKSKKSSDDTKTTESKKSADDSVSSTKDKKAKAEPDKNENAAAELDLLKELADEINESNESINADNDVEEMEVEEEEKGEEISSDSDSSVSSREFGKRRTRRKRKEKNESEESSKKSKKSKEDTKEKTSKKKKKSSNSDDDVEKDSKKLSKDKKKNKGDKKEETENKKGKKESSKTKSKKTEENEEVHSDSSNFDEDLEKDIKSLSKDTKMTRTSSRTAAKKPDGTGETKSVEKQDKSKKSKKDTSTESSSVSDDTSTDDSDDENEEKEDGEEDPEEDGVEEEEEEEEEEVNEDDLSPAKLRKLRAAQKKEEEAESDYEDMAASESSDSEDPEISFPKLETPKKGKNKAGKKSAKDDEASDDSDFVTPKKKTRNSKLKSKLLDAKVSDSDSDVEPKKKKRRGRKRKKESSEEEEPHPEDEVYSDDGKKKKGKRKRIKKVASSSDEEKEKKQDGGEEEEEGEDVDDTPGGAHKRKKIRKVMANKKLADTTKEARKIEDERRKRIEERQKEFNAYVEVEGGESEEELPEGTEREKKEVEPDSITKLLGTPKKVPVTTRCVLDMEKESKKILVEIDRTLVKKLKPHQVEAVRFMYNCCVESIDRMKKEEGAGCILAHCMGLGKTLSVISFIHTMLSNTKLTKMTKCLVVCPLNTVLNWVNEFEIWLDDVDYEIDVYEMSKVKQNFERAKMLREWSQGGAGVMILGYDMYRNLVMGSHCKNKKQKATFYETLADPGPDLVVCDEGHILKNDSTSLSKSMSKIITKRRVVLTGTPLQNNLGEYHCMVNFVKPNLLGTRKEFSNRFVNPITNGQCTDSSVTDVKLMKRRAHILHEMLAGCVQRKDYSALTKFLPPKFEYVISVRMGTLQCKLYEQYLSEVGVVQNEEVQGKGGRLFRDYQALMRIWTHPWVLKLDEIRQENKRTYDSEDSFIDDDASDDEDSFMSQSTTSDSDSDFGGKKKKSKGKKGKKRGGSGSSSDDDVKEVNDSNEVIRKWSSKRRGNEEGAGSSWMMDMGYSTGPKEVSSEWWAEYVKEEDEFKIELSGKLTLMFEILKMCEDIGDKVLVFSQSLLSLDIIEDFLHHVDESNGKTENGEEQKEEKKEEEKEKKEETANGENGEAESEDKDKDKKDKGDKKKDKYSDYGKSWTCGADYFRMDGSTSSQQRKAAQDSFNDPDNYRARLFLISTKAGSLGINLVAANRVIIFDASWNPSHDIQSIFRVYRFGQVKPVYVYRFLAQGTMEEKIYERQVTKQSLSQRVVDEHQIERHFTSADLQELYRFQPDRLDDPERKERPLPMLPKDHMLAELMGTQKDWIVTFHEHDSLLENIVEQELSEEEKKAAWEDYENDKKGLNTAYPGMMYGNVMNATQRMNSAIEFQNLVLQGQANLGQEAVLQIVQDLKARFPTLPPEVFSQRVQAVLRQVLTQRIMMQSDFQRRQLDQQKMAELNRLNQIKQQIQQQQAMLNSQQRSGGLGNFSQSSLFGVQALPSSGYYNSVMPSRSGTGTFNNPPAAHSSSNKSGQKSNSKGDK